MSAAMKDLPRLSDDEREDLESGLVSMQGVQDDPVRTELLDALAENARLKEELALLTIERDSFKQQAEINAATVKDMQAANREPRRHLLLLLSVTADLLHQSTDRFHGGWHDAHSLLAAARQVLAESIDCACERT